MFGLGVFVVVGYFTNFLKIQKIFKSWGFVEERGGIDEGG